MQKIRSLHRVIMLLIAVFVLNLTLTGILMQGIDVRSWLVGAPGTDLSMISLRESFNGPPNYEVIGGEDYAAQPLPAGADLGAMLARSVPAARAVAAGEPLRYVELRMTGGKPELIADAKPKAIPGHKPTMDDIKSIVAHVDPLTGSLLRQEEVGRGQMVHPFRNTVKGLHTGNYLGFASPLIVVSTGLGLCTLIVTGLMMYLKLLKARQKLKRNKLFWKGGGWWRTLHRSVSVVAALFLTIIVVSGTYISFEGLYFRSRAEIYKYNNGGEFKWFMGEDLSSPLKDAELPALMKATLAAQRAESPDAVIKAVRLRYYSGMPQGVTVSGTGNDTQQLVFDLRNGHTVSATEPEYPPSFLPLGWQMHQWAKQVHRGDYLALPGRTVSGHLVHMLAGLALLYLTISGLEMYYSMWSKRQTMGRKGLFWK